VHCKKITSALKLDVRAEVYKIAFFEENWLIMYESNSSYAVNQVLI